MLANAIHSEMRACSPAAPLSGRRLALWDGQHLPFFNEFASYRLAKQNHKLEEVIEQIKEGEMPLPSYTIIHTEAKLTEAEKETLTKWCQNIMDTLKANYPADSLILKKPSQTHAATQ